MTVSKSRRHQPDAATPDLVTVDLGTDEFQAQLIVARLESEGVDLATWNNGREAVYGIIGRVGGSQVLVRREDLPAVQAAAADAGIELG